MTLVCNVVPVPVPVGLGPSLHSRAAGANVCEAEQIW